MARGRSSRRERKSRGQFFTPDALAVRLLSRAREDLATVGAFAGPGTVLDPACGDGAFLRAAVGSGWASAEQVVGVDSDPEVLGGPAGASLRVGDGLAAEGTFDAAFGNPPFGGRGVRDRDASALADLGRRFTIHRARADGGLVDRPLRPRFPIATLFVERFVRSVRPGGAVGLVLPVSFLANARDRGSRAWFFERVRPIAIDELDPGTFATEGTRANTVFVLGERRAGPPQGDPPVTLGLRGGARFSVPTSRLLAAGRWDPHYHDPAWDAALDGLTTLALGEHVQELCYGAIKPGAAPRPASTGDPAALYVTQRAVTERGVDLDACPRIVAERPWDQPRYRLQPGDLAVPRSGAGTLGRNRLTRFDGAPLPAVVDCFTDRLSLRGISSAWVLGFLRAEPGWAQIRRTFNGVGTPNLSFGELRALRIVRPSPAQEREAEAIWGQVAAGTAPFEALRSFVEAAIDTERASSGR